MAVEIKALGCSKGPDDLDLWSARYKKGTDRREVLADWLASPENPFFARNLANIVWSHFFGQGIIEPVDDVRISNPPSNPELLDQLASRFTEYQYDFRKLVRDVCTSRIYQLSTRTNPSNEDDLRNFARAESATCMATSNMFT